MRLFTICSILGVTLFQPRTIGFFDRALLRLGIVLQRDMRCPLEFARAEKLICLYPMAAREYKADDRRGPTPLRLDSPGSLCTLARSPEPIAVLEIPLLVA